ncbi:hypothetical protein JR316_0005205 [Psilocybe cubensis]|uniref:F-box domain-containing protein n=2 Tax=Psilocybe cubensis TaxID=181762 RepID=A0A8H7XYZ3_PSICU|nr:hypothetical protein JR316_0005205 [Psilocybe cubensis]KAH9483104.1 hypothetical protein JR316_0005205 [Psilocybe cubensis]
MTSEAKTQATISSLPQELIDLIVDRLADLPHNQTTYHDPLQLQDIIACSLVSKAFRSRAKAHLLLRLHIRANEGFKMQAESLVSRIKNTSSEYCADLIRSFCCAIINSNPAQSSGMMLSMDSQGHHKYLPRPTPLDRIYTHLGRHFTEILRGISDPAHKLRHFSLVSLSELNHVDHGAGEPNSLAFQLAFVSACTTVNLHTLHLANIADIPPSLLIEVFCLPFLEELTLNNLGFSEETEASLMTSDVTIRQSGNSITRTLAPKLRRLEIRNICYLGLFNLLQLNSESNPPSSSSFALLKTLIISVPFDEQKIPIYGSLREIMDFMSWMPSNLVNLEIESYAYPTGNQLSLPYSSYTQR